MRLHSIVNRTSTSLARFLCPIVLAGFAVAALSGCGGRSSEIAGIPPITDEQAKALTLTSTSHLSDRLIEYTFHTESLHAPLLLPVSDCCRGDTHVRVLFPRGYDDSNNRRYPVLYLLHGGLQSYRDWTDLGNAEAISESFPGIIVMPDDGQNGFYSDWYNYGAFGPPKWETYHLRELLPWIDSNLRTIATRSGRAIAGLSIGGFGAMSYAARHPDLFVSAASYSGYLDPELDANDGSYLDGGLPLSIWGPHETEEVRWRARNPLELAENLLGLDLTVRTRNGLPRLDGPISQSTLPDPVETLVHTQAVDFHQKLISLDYAHDWFDQGPGCHCWEFWQGDLEFTLAKLQKIFANPPAAPIPFSYRSAETQYSAYDWQVTMDRKAMEFSRISEVRLAGFTMEGSGTAAITTAPWYKSNTTYSITVAGGASYLAIADPLGRLSLSIPLGPANELQQFTLAAQLLGTSVYKSPVSIDEAAH